MRKVLVFILGEGILVTEKLVGETLKVEYVCKKTKLGYSFYNSEGNFYLFDPIINFLDLVDKLNELKRSSDEQWFIDWELKEN